MALLTLPRLYRRDEANMPGVEKEVKNAGRGRNFEFNVHSWLSAGADTHGRASVGFACVRGLSGEPDET